MQGLPVKVAYYQFRDLADGSNSFNRQNRVLLVTNRSEYFGYDIVMSAGLMYERREYLDWSQRERNSSLTSMFLRVLLGY